MTTLIEEQDVKPARISPSRQAGYEPVYAKRTIPQANWETVVSTAQLAPMVERIILELDEPDRHNAEAVGGLNRLAEIAEKHIDGTPGSLLRRLYDIRLLRTRSTKASLAEALALAGGRSLREEGILEVPAGVAAAKERIDIWLEIKGGMMSDSLRNELAEDLYEFALCVIHGPGVGELAEAA